MSVTSEGESEVHRFLRRVLVRIKVYMQVCDWLSKRHDCLFAWHGGIV